MKFFKKNRLILLTGVLLVILSAFALNAVASPDPIEPIDTSKNTSLAIQCHYGDEPVKGMTFRLYKVGDVTREGSFRVNEPFEYNAGDTWDVAAGKMASQAASEEHPVTPKRTGVTDGNGVVEFATKGKDRLTTGLYLVVSDPLEINDGNDKHTYTTMPFVVSLPTFVGKNHDGQNDQNDVWLYDVITAPKVAEDGKLIYKLYYDENYPKIGEDAQVDNMPENVSFFADDEIVENENALRLNATDTPATDGYTFIGWNTDPDATEGVDTIPFDPGTRFYTVYAIWEKQEVSSETSSETSSEVPSGSSEEPASSEEPSVSSEKPPVSSDEPVSSEKPPVSSDEPVSSEKPPVSSEEPVSSEKPPVSSEEPPVSSEKPPVSSEEPPVSSQEPETMYHVYYHENYEVIGADAQVSNMPQNEAFPISSKKLVISDKPYTVYTVPKSGGNNDKNTLILNTSFQPMTPGYTFIGWNTDSKAKVGYSTIAFSPDQQNYHVFAIWKADSSSTESSVSSEPPASSEPPVSSNTPGDEKKDPILPKTGVLWWPVPLLAVLGLAVFLIGILNGKKDPSPVGRSRSGMQFIAGIVLASFSIGMLIYNTVDDWRAGSDSQSERSMVVNYLPDENGRRKKRISNENSNSLVAVTEMPTQTIDGTAFDAMIEIPTLSLELPIRDTWSYPGLRRSPCRYSGSAYTRDLVICGHNYNAHFGNLKKLSKGEKVIVTAMNGDVFTYRVDKVENLSPDAIDEMTDSGYALSLFTCTIGGGQRVTVRCNLVNYKKRSPSLICTEYVLF